MERMEKVKNRGFTLVELLVVMAILGILASITYAQFRTSQKKARDAQRKADLRNIATALEAYYNDFQSYPESTDCSSPPQQGKIVVDKNCPSSEVLDWGTDSFEATLNGTLIVYMKTLPADPLSPTQSYCYDSNGDGFALYAKLENNKDPEYQVGYTCNSDSYTFRITGGNY